MLEIIAQSVEDAMVIEAAGADRIELVSGISEGGLTPSYAMIEQVIKAVKIPVNVMVRPHSYSFEYKTLDIKVMKQDIKTIESLGANGIVLGCLKDKQIDFDTFNDMIKDVNLDITFHRAIDECDQLNLAYKSLISHNKVSQILTSGGPGKACDNFNELKAFYEMDKSKLLIGSGVTLNNITEIVTKYPAASYHIGSDARVNQSFRNRIDEKHIKLVVDLIKTSQRNGK